MTDASDEWVIPSELEYQLLIAFLEAEALVDHLIRMMGSATTLIHDGTPRPAAELLWRTIYLTEQKRLAMRQVVELVKRAQSS
jgi:hypothetical protein